MPDEAVSKINEAAADAAHVVAQAAAEAKNVINAAAASAIATLTTAAAVQAREIKYITDTLDKVNDKLDNLENKYVTKEEFKTIENSVENCVTSSDFAPVRNTVYGTAAVIFTAIIGVVLKILFFKL